MTPLRKTLRRGFTLIELTIAMVLGLAIGGMVMALFNQQLAFLRIYQTQNFLTEEAPVISVYVSKLVGKADRFRLHDSVADALAGSNPRLTDSPVVLLNFRQPDGTVRATILSFEDRGTGPALYYYVVPSTGLLDPPQWFVSNKPSNVWFSMEQGVLRMTLVGPAGEQITYSGTMQK
jgi:type II secretory pathway pseudopilin PulG